MSVKKGWFFLKMILPRLIDRSKLTLIPYIGRIDFFTKMVELSELIV
jgi:hypothetical protein